MSEQPLMSEDRLAGTRADARADDDADSRWMTLAELAESRQISKASAARLVRREAVAPDAG
jgi:hypothetical protein